MRATQVIMVLAEVPVAEVILETIPVQLVAAVAAVAAAEVPHTL